MIAWLILMFVGPLAVIGAWLAELRFMSLVFLIATLFVWSPVWSVFVRV